MTARERIVVVGDGMAGARFVTEVRARDPRRDIVVLGAETEPAYNRILLSDVLAGRLDTGDIALPEPPGPVERRRGVRVVRIDRRARTVHTDDGRDVAYGALVLATGSRAVLPPIDGLVRDDSTLSEGVAAFRTLDDCRRMLAYARSARRAVVLGGGPLGLEAARGLAARGLDVQLVHAAEHLMERQLDPDAGRMLTRMLGELGLTVRTGASAIGVEATDRVRAVRIDDGSVLATDLLVVACGVRAETRLASDAGLRVRRGIVVDDRLRTSDPAILAIGDCAEHDDQVYGLVAPAWEQAAVAADVLCGGNARYTGSRLVTRLKASDIDLATMGDPHAVDADGTEVVTFADPARHTYQKVVIRERRLVGAILLGDNPTVGQVTQLFDRNATVPADPRSLLFPGRGTGGGADEPGPSLGGDVCRCNGVRAGAIVAAWLGGARTVDQIAAVTRAGTGCGGCRTTLGRIVADMHRGLESNPAESSLTESSLTGSSDELEVVA